MRKAKVTDLPAYALRHGSPDKVPNRSFAEPGESFDVLCPDCGATLCIDASLLALSPEFDCAGCGTDIAIRPDGTLRERLVPARRLTGVR